MKYEGEMDKLNDQVRNLGADNQKLRNDIAHTVKIVSLKLIFFNFLESWSKNCWETSRKDCL